MPLDTPISTLTQWKPDVLLVDEGREAQKFGWPLLHQICAYEPLTWVPMLPCTVVQMTDEHHQELHTLLVSVLATPFDVEELLQMVQQVLIEG